MQHLTQVTNESLQFSYTKGLLVVQSTLERSLA